MTGGKNKEAGGTDHPLERLIFFSDAVFAIAITLLVIEVHPPHLEKGASDRDHVIALINLLPNIIGYLVSFFVIGMFWSGHHRAFTLARHYSGRVLPWNLMLLATIGFIPFVTAYLADYQGARVPALLYCTWLFLASLLNLRVNSMAVSPPMVGDDVPAESRRYIRTRGQAVVMGTLTALLIGFVEPYAWQIGLVAIPLWRPLIARLQRG